MVTKIRSEVGAYVNYEKNNVLILLISTQKLYFCDDDAIYDVIIQEPVWKWRHNYRHEISRDPFAESVLFQTYSTIFMFSQIDRANFAVRGPSSFLHSLVNWIIFEEVSTFVMAWIFILISLNNCNDTAVKVFLQLTRCSIGTLCLLKMACCGTGSYNFVWNTIINISRN